MECLPMVHQSNRPRRKWPDQKDQQQIMIMHAMPRFAPREGGKLWEGGEKNYYCVANTSEWAGGFQTENPVARCRFWLGLGGVKLSIPCEH